MISCIFVIVIHVTNYFCRAYGEITQSEYLFALLLDTLARVRCSLVFYDLRSIASGKRRTVEKTRGETASFFDRTGSMECSVLYLESCFYEDRI